MFALHTNLIALVIYSIKDLEHLTGVKAHTLRIWEKRYSIIKPNRTETNIRYYLEEDLQHILNISMLNQHGHKISHIAKMSKEEILKKVAEISDFDHAIIDREDCLTLALIELNEFKFNRIIETNIEQLGMERTMIDVIFPFLDRLNELWINGCVKPVHEAFVIGIIRRKINKAIDDLPVNTEINMPQYIIYLPIGDSGDLSLLYLHFKLKKHGIRVINLGAEVNKEMVIEACNIIQPNGVIMFANEAFENRSVSSYLNALCKHIGETNILLTGYQTMKQKIKSTRKVKVLSSLEQIVNHCGSILHRN